MVRTVRRWLSAAASSLRRHVWRLVFFCGGGLVLWLTWHITDWFPGWYATASRVFTEHLLFVVVLSISLGCLLFWFLLWKLPQRQVTSVFSVKDRLDLETKARQTMAQIIGGAVLLGGLYFTAQTLRVSQETLQINQKTLQTTQEGQITDRFTKAID